MRPEELCQRKNTNDLHMSGLQINSSVYVGKNDKIFYFKICDLLVEKRELADRYRYEYIRHFLHKESAELQKHFLS